MRVYVNLLQMFAIMTPLFLGVGSCVLTARPGAYVYYEGPVVMVEPPPPRVEVIGVAPSPGYFWVSGIWVWTNNDYVWRPGYWERPREGYRWKKGNWKRHDKGWRMERGHWERNRRGHD